MSTESPPEVSSIFRNLRQTTGSEEQQNNLKEQQSSMEVPKGPRKLVTWVVWEHYGVISHAGVGSSLV